MRQDPAFRVKICITAQHREMLDQVLEVFDIIPDHDLDLMTQGQSLPEFTSIAIQEIDKVIKQVQPDLCIIQGDTTTVMAAALTSYYNKVPVAHVEAGLRTYNKYAPFPEEMNRVMASHIAEYHFAPTELSKQNLLKENICESKIIVTGNTVVDVLQSMRNKIERKQLVPGNPFVKKFLKKENQFILVTAHRRENFGESIQSICCALKRFCERYNQIQVVFPVHLNPNIHGPVHDLLSGVKNIHLIEPL